MHHIFELFKALPVQRDVMQMKYIKIILMLIKINEAVALTLRTNFLGPISVNTAARFYLKHRKKTLYVLNY